MTIYNLTNATNSANMVELAQATNGILGGYVFGWFVLFFVFLVVFLSMKAKLTYNSACFAVSSWVCLFLSFMLRAMTLIDNKTMWVVVLLASASVFALFIEGTSS